MNSSDIKWDERGLAPAVVCHAESGAVLMLGWMNAEALGATLASGQVKQWVGVRDILMMYSVVDISGLNRISRTVLTNAARAMIGMVQAPNT